MHEELVERRRWISENRFLHALNYCMVLPGPEAQQLATYIGWLMHRTWGGLVAGGLFVLPSLFILVALSWVYMAFGHVPVIAGLFYGIKPAVTALVVHAAWRVGSRALKNAWLWAIAAGAFVAIFALALPFPLIVLIAGVIGSVGAGWRRTSSRPAVGMARPGRAMVRLDRRPRRRRPTRASPGRAWGRAAGLCGRVGAALGTLTALYGWSGVLTQMGWFFTKAALLTFGGAYAVLPYVYQGAVDHYQWLSATQMIDGPGPGRDHAGAADHGGGLRRLRRGWTKAIFGADALWLGRAVAAGVVTLFTFLPSFLFIFLGGPFIESTHGNLSSPRRSPASLRRWWASS